jgi:hypothetical protein
MSSQSGWYRDRNGEERWYDAEQGHFTDFTRDYPRGPSKEDYTGSGRHAGTPEELTPIDRERPDQIGGCVMVLVVALAGLAALILFGRQLVLGL